MINGDESRLAAVEHDVRPHRRAAVLPRRDGTGEPQGVVEAIGTEYRARRQRQREGAAIAAFEGWRVRGDRRRQLPPAPGRAGGKAAPGDRQSVGWGKRGVERVDLGGSRKRKK